MISQSTNHADAQTEVVSSTKADREDEISCNGATAGTLETTPENCTSDERSSDKSFEENVDPGDDSSIHTTAADAGTLTAVKILSEKTGTEGQSDVNEESTTDIVREIVSMIVSDAIKRADEIKPSAIYTEKPNVNTAKPASKFRATCILIHMFPCIFKRRSRE